MCVCVRVWILFSYLMVDDMEGGWEWKDAGGKGEGGSYLRHVMSGLLLDLCVMTRLI